MSEQFMNHFPPKFVTALALFALAMSAYGQLALAQEHFIGEEQAVNRVIKLRSQPTQKPAITKQVAETTSRGEKVDRNTKPVANPNEIQFDDIKLPRTLQHQIRPVVQKNTAPREQKSILRTADQQQFLPAPPSASNSPSNVRSEVAKTKQYETTETVTIRNSMVSTEIRSPQTVNVNQSAQLQINLRNLSDETIDNVKLIAQIPEHAKFVSATPRPTRTEGQTFEFVVPRIGGERTQQVLLNVIPTTKVALEIGTQVILENAQQTVVGVQQPELKMRLSGPARTATGKTVKHMLTITNVGDGVAHDVRLSTLYPTGLKQSQASEAIPISTINPGAMLEIPLESQALTPGQGELKVVATTKHTEPHETSMEVSMHQPELRLSAAGPKLNFVQRDGIYTIDVENTGEVEVTNVQVSLAVPDGIKVTTISREAQVDAQRGTLSWSFDKLEAKSTEQIQLNATAIIEGQQVCNILISSNETMEKEFRLATEVATRADLTVQVKNLTGPVQVGAKAEFLVEVENHGSRQATDVNANVTLPESLMAVKNELNPEQPENALTFTEPIVAPGQKVTFKFTAVGVSPGDHVVRCSLQAAGSERKVISENSVYVYEIAEARVSESLAPVVPRR
jgi:uncharacterized repeat protein (TIGR01451 family)